MNSKEDVAFPLLERLQTDSTGMESELWQLNQSTSRQVCGPQKYGWGVDSHLRRPGRDRNMASLPAQPNVCSEAFFGRFGASVKSWSDPMLRSSKELAEGTQKVRVGWTATRKPVGCGLVAALASRDGASMSHFRASHHWDGADTFETYSKNLNTNNRTTIGSPNKH